MACQCSRRVGLVSHHSQDLPKLGSASRVIQVSTTFHSRFARHIEETMNSIICLVAETLTHNLTNWSRKIVAVLATSLFVAGSVEPAFAEPPLTFPRSSM